MGIASVKQPAAEVVADHAVALAVDDEQRPAQAADNVEGVEAVAHHQADGQKWRELPPGVHHRRERRFEDQGAGLLRERDHGRDVGAKRLPVDYDVARLDALGSQRRVGEPRVGDSVGLGRLAGAARKAAPGQHEDAPALRSELPHPLCPVAERVAIALEIEDRRPAGCRRAPPDHQPLTVRSCERLMLDLG